MKNVEIIKPISLEIPDSLRETIEFMKETQKKIDNLYLLTAVPKQYLGKNETF